MPVIPTSTTSVMAGRPINERRYSNAHLATALSKAESMATLMDALGYNCFWMAEHHFQREGTECIPNTILMALHLAHRMKRPGGQPGAL